MPENEKSKILEKFSRKTQRPSEFLPHRIGPLQDLVHHRALLLSVGFQGQADLEFKIFILFGL